MTPPTAALNTVTRSAVRMALTTRLAMLTAPTAPSTASAMPNPPEVTPPPQHADPSLRMDGPSRVCGFGSLTIYPE
jgi:hypothetical protein